MKQILLSIFSIITATTAVNAQVLYGTAEADGLYKGGTINRFSVPSSQLTAVYNFGSITGNSGVSDLVEVANGLVYGTTDDAIFSFDPARAAYTVRHYFDSASGFVPTSTLLLANNGLLYGTTSDGGASDAGVIYSWDPVLNSYAKVHDFDLTGGHPRGTLVQADDGKIYGTANGGISGDGIIFSFDPVTATYLTLVNFSKSDGSSPRGIIKANNGKLYGVTSSGGLNNAGVIFSFDPDSNSLVKLFDFSDFNGREPTIALMQATDGRLYGMTQSGGNFNVGVIFAYNPATGNFRKLKDFDVGSGASPTGKMIQTQDGRLYGTTPGGGANGVGVIFELEPVTNTFTKLIDLDDTRGSRAQGGLIRASNGLLYGMASWGGGGGRNRGAIFSFNPVSVSYASVHGFFTNENGTRPTGDLLLATDGQLYGVTAWGGMNGFGVLYSFNYLTGQYTKHFDFDGQNGGGPNGSLVQASDGKIYGTTQNGGDKNLGTIFSFDPATANLIKLVDFDGSNGASPAAGLVQGIDGKLYGSTLAGGTNTQGVLFSYHIGNSSYAKLVDMELANGANPNGNLLNASDGKLYGTANGGAQNFGVVFSIDPLTSAYTKLVDFDRLTGSEHMSSSLAEGPNGLLYGTATYDFGSGQVFAFNRTTAALTRAAFFTNENGVNPGDLFLASDTIFYGMTIAGPEPNLGDFGYGQVFSFTPSPVKIIALDQFSPLKGSGEKSRFTEVGACTSPITYYQDSDQDGFGNLAQRLIACTQPAGYVMDSTDCDDTNAAVHRGRVYYRDNDGDGFGNPNDSAFNCSQPEGYVINSLDCNDNDAASHAGSTYYRDSDGDHMGDAKVSIVVCGPSPEGYVKNNYDCDDHKSARHFWEVEMRLCHNGESYCVPLWEIWIRVLQGWTPGPCKNCEHMKPGSMISKSEKASDKSEEYSVTSYPNPFTGSSTIRYELPVDSKITIKVYDAMGRAISTLVDEYKKAGRYSVNFNAARSGAGALYYRITARSKAARFEQTNKMIQVR